MPRSPLRRQAFPDSLPPFVLGRDYGERHKVSSWQRRDVLTSAQLCKGSGKWPRGQRAGSEVFPVSTRRQPCEPASWGTAAVHRLRLHLLISFPFFPGCVSNFPALELPFSLVQGLILSQRCPSSSSGLAVPSVGLASSTEDASLCAELTAHSSGAAIPSHSRSPQ